MGCGGCSGCPKGLECLKHVWRQAWIEGHAGLGLRWGGVIRTYQKENEAWEEKTGWLRHGKFSGICRDYVISGF